MSNIIIPGCKIYFITILLIFSFLLSCNDSISPIENKIDPLNKYSLIWSDEFDDISLDEYKWSYRYLGPRRNAINIEDAVKLDGNDNLIISTYKKGDEYYTGMIGTQDKFDSKFGYWECRMKLQSQTGQWSAFWLQSPSYGEVIGDTKNSGTEIDIMEYVSKYQNIIEHALHWDGYDLNHKVDRHIKSINRLSEGFHTFGLEWSETGYIFYVDRIETWRTNKAISHTNQYIVISIEIDDWAGDISQAILPDSICVDY